MNPDKNQGVTIVQQPFDMNLFLKHQVDSASAMTYNELAQVLESKNPKTGKLYTLTDLNVIKMQNVGTGMLEDGLFSTGKWLERAGEPGDRGEVHQGLARGLDLLPRPRGRLRQHHAQVRPDAAEGSPDLADERDQQADLAEHGRRSGS